MEEPKKLSPEEEVALEKRRAKFRELCAHFSEEDIYNSRGYILTLKTLLEKASEEYVGKMSVKDIPIDLSKIGHKKTEEVVELFKDMSVSDACDYCQCLSNAIDMETFNKSKDWKVSDLDIKLL